MGFNYKKNLLHVDDVSLTHIADQFGTPAYVYSGTQLRDNVKAYQTAFDAHFHRSEYMICFATKSCSNIAILDFVHRLGCGADIVSGGEFFRARKAGIPASKIVFSGVGKSDEEISTAITSGIFMINIESEQELTQVSRISTRLRKTQSIALRVNPNVDAKTHAKITTGKKENKFGVDINMAPSLLKKAQKMPGIKIAGVAVHIGSQLTNLTPYDRAYRHLRDLFRTLKQQGITLTHIDIGGGIGISYDNDRLINMHDYAAMVKKNLGDLGVTIILEPGRSLSGNAGILLSTTRFVKNGHDKRFLIVDAGMNDLMRPALYDAYHALWPIKKPKGALQKYDVVGPVCETGDTFSVDEQLPQLKSGDLCAFMNAGAYGASMASTYNTRPLVPEILVDGKKIHVIRTRQTYDDMIRDENFATATKNKK